MRYFMSVGHLLVATRSARAGEAGKPPTLTPKEIADGWLLLFDGATAFGWKARGETKAADGVLTLIAGQRATSLSTTTAFGDFELNFEWRVEGDKPLPRAILTWKEVPEDKNVTLGSQACQLIGTAPGKFAGWGTASVKVASGKANYKIRGPADDRFPVEGVNLPLASGSDRTRFTFIAHPGETLSLRNIKLKPQNLTSIFNGKDFTGWKEFPKKKSKFTITPEGWINIKDGPGDLQTESRWGDFVLQLECISNGKHLNSGVFF